MRVSLSQVMDPWSLFMKCGRQFFPTESQSSMALRNTVSRRELETSFQLLVRFLIVHGFEQVLRPLIRPQWIA